MNIDNPTPPTYLCTYLFTYQPTHPFINLPTYLFTHQTIELICLVLNMFCILDFLGHSSNLCSTFEQIIQGYRICILTSLTGFILVRATSSINLTMVVGVTNISFYPL